MTAQNLSLTSYDYDELKKSLVEFIKAYDPEFSDIDYSGSAIDTLNSFLSRNTQLVGYAANFIASESFLQSAQLRKNVVASAGKLSHVPRSRTASQCVIDIKVIPVDKTNLPKTITANKGLNFLVNIEGNAYSFTNKDSFVLDIDANDDYVATGVTLYQGQLITTSQTYNQVQKKIVIPNKNIDTSTLKVIVDDSNAAISNTVYVRANEIKDLSVSKPIYFLSENSDEEYEIEFGKNIVGLEPSDNSVINLEFITVRDFTNNVDQLVCASSIEGYTNIEVTVTQPSFGGAEREDIETTRFLAPRVYQSQQRAVVDIDYEGILREKFGFIKTVNTWGGETNNPPMYGDAMLSIITYDANLLADYVKQDIIDYLTDYSVTAITPVIVDPVYYYINVTSEIIFNEINSTRTFAELRSVIKADMYTYSDTLNNFDRYFNETEICSLAKKYKGVESISNTTQLYFIEPVINNNNAYEIKFYNAIKEESLLIENVSIDITYTNQKVIDDGEGNVLLSYTDSNGFNLTTNIGTIDYTNGVVSFVTTFLNTNDLKVVVEPQEDNIYSNQNNVLQIDEITINRKVI